MCIFKPPVICAQWYDPAILSGRCRWNFARCYKSLCCVKKSDRNFVPYGFCKAVNGCKWTGFGSRTCQNIYQLTECISKKNRRVKPERNSSLISGFLFPTLPIPFLWLFLSAVDKEPLSAGDSLVSPVGCLR